MDRFPALTSLTETAHHLATSCRQGHCVNFTHARETHSLLTDTLARAPEPIRANLRGALADLTDAFGAETFQTVEGRA